MKVSSALGVAVVVVGLVLPGTVAGADPAAQSAVAPQSLNLADAPNARDAGGYRAEGGHQMRTGLVFRADALDTLTSSEAATIQHDGITTVLDFRSTAEVSASPDKVAVGTTDTNLPIDDSVLRNTVGQAIQGGPAMQQQLLGDGKAVQLMVNFYRSTIDTPAVRLQFATALHDLASAGAPILYHCTNGKDRTGIMSAILLTALGVPRGIVYLDYLASNHFLQAKNDALIAQLEKAGKLTDPSLLLPILEVKREYLDATFDEISTRYGSFDNFLTTGLGIDNTVLTQLRTRLLTN